MIQRGVGPLGVVDANPAVDDPSRLEPVVPFVQIDDLLFSVIATNAR